MKEQLKRTSISTLVPVLISLIIVLGAGIGYELAQNRSGTTTTITLTATSYVTETTTPASIFSLEIGNINVSDYGPFPQWITIDPNLETLYLSGGSSIMTINAKTLSVTGNYPIPGTGSYLYDIDPNTNVLYVLYSSCANVTGSACNDSNARIYVGEMNGTSGVLLHQFPLPSGSYFAVNHATNTLYYAVPCVNPNARSTFDEYLTNCGYLVAVNGTTGVKIDNISLGQEPWSPVVDQNTNMIYTTDGSNLLIINGTSDTIQARIALKFTDSTPIIKVDPATNTVFDLGANGTFANTILVALNGTNGHILYSSVIGSACLVNINRVYVNSFTNQIYADGGLNTDNLVYINASTGKISNIVSIPGQYYIDSTFDPSLSETYVLLNGSIAVLPSHLNQIYDNASFFGYSFCPGPMK